MNGETKKKEKSNSLSVSVAQSLRCLVRPSAEAVLTPELFEVDVVVEGAHKFGWLADPLLTLAELVK